MSVKNRATPQIQITPSGLGRNETRPLTKPQIDARLGWYGEMVPFIGDSNPEWKKWAFLRMDELNGMIRAFKSRPQK